MKAPVAAFVFRNLRDPFLEEIFCTGRQMQVERLIRRCRHAQQAWVEGCDLLCRSVDYIAYQAKVEHSMGIAAHWTQPLATAIDFNRAAVCTAAETGDLTSACYSMARWTQLLLYRNDPLDTVRQATEESLAFVRKAGFRDVADTIIGHPP